MKMDQTKALASFFGFQSW